MDFNKWRISDKYEAGRFRIHIRASGDDGTGEYFTEQMIAASLAYTAGIDEGKRQAGLIMLDLFQHGLPRGETRFR